jgi:pimeloyl-ACP methyl ester carboxylesterase
MEMGKTNSSCLHYAEQGDGLPLVLIHGFPLCREMWRPQMSALADAGWRVICPDLPGFGESPPGRGAASMAGYADAVIGLLDELGIARAAVGGMSMGGYVLLNLLERYRGRVSGTLFMVTRASADDAAGKEKRTSLAAQVHAGNRLIVADTFARVLFAPDTIQKNPGLVDQVRQWMEASSEEGLAGALLAMRDRDDYLARLPSFTVPALVIGAEQDLAVPLEHSRLLAAGLPQSELCVIPGAGHMANLEQPELFNRCLVEFLARLR